MSDTWQLKFCITVSAPFAQTIYWWKRLQLCFTLVNLEKIPTAYNSQMSPSQYCLKGWHVLNNEVYLKFLLQCLDFKQIVSIVGWLKQRFLLLDPCLHWGKEEQLTRCQQHTHKNNKSKPTFENSSFQHHVNKWIFLTSSSSTSLLNWKYPSVRSSSTPCSLNGAAIASTLSRYRECSDCKWK